MDEKDYVVITIPASRWEPQYIFEKLLGVACGIVEAFRSDFYHDAIKVKENFNTTNEFYYYVGSCGTFLLTKESSVRYGNNSGRSFWFKIMKQV